MGQSCAGGCARAPPIATPISCCHRDRREKALPRGHGRGRDDFITKPIDVDELRRAQSRERILDCVSMSSSSRLVAICAYCKRIRDASEKWESIERYVEARSEAQFSHGYCPDCYEKYVRPQIEKP